jgi:hypothetical protein
MLRIRIQLIRIRIQNEVYDVQKLLLLQNS